MLGNRPEERQNRGLTEFSFGVFFDDMTKVDFNVTPAAVLPLIRDEPTLPRNFDLGYRVLLDKDGLMAGLKPPTHTAYVTREPTQDEYRAIVEEFWWCTTYVAKYLWRDEVYGARAILDAEMRLHVLLPMLAWVMGAEHGWSVRPGAWGRNVKRYLKPDVWAGVERTFGGTNDEGHWQALFDTTEVFRSCAELVAQRLGYEYPRELDERLTAYVHEIRNMPNPA